MQIDVIDPVFQTKVFVLILLVAIAVTAKKDPNSHELAITHTNELKGIAILMVIFCHIGYFLASDTRFLYPLSVAGGVGVNLFLFLSGYGLTLSMLKTALTPIAFYVKRLKTIYIPMWFVLGLFLLADYFILHKTYPLGKSLANFAGLFSSNRIFDDVNSSLWYFTFILFYYLVFPLLFFKRKPILSVILVTLAAVVILRFNLPVTVDLQKMYKLHYLAFPLGMLFAVVRQACSEKLSKFIQSLKPVVSYGLLAVLVYIVMYTCINSGVGTTILQEQLISLVTVVSLVLIAVLKKYRFPLLSLFGVYSYEIYLLHWPILYRYDVIYKYLPAYLATVVYLGVFIAVGFLLANKLFRFTKRRS